MPKRGAFIVIEGLDRSGKSTQAATLLRRLQDAQVSAKLIKFPGLLLLRHSYLDLCYNDELHDVKTGRRRSGR